MLRIPVSVRFSFTTDFSSPFGNGRVSVSGFDDADKDGNPEVEVLVDLPGKTFDLNKKVEIPLGDLFKSPLKAAVLALQESDLPGSDEIGDLIKSLLD